MLFQATRGEIAVGPNHRDEGEPLSQSKHNHRQEGVPFAHFRDAVQTAQQQMAQDGGVIKRGQVPVKARLSNIEKTFMVLGAFFLVGSAIFLVKTAWNAIRK